MKAPLVVREVVTRRQVMVMEVGERGEAMEDEVAIAVVAVAAAADIEEVGEGEEVDLVDSGEILELLLALWFQLFSFSAEFWCNL